jgi:uncharacterized protein YndB with AHSA1/START domain
MPVTDVSHDVDALTLTITAQFAAPVERIWEIYANPRQLEKVWGPPTYPTTVSARVDAWVLAVREAACSVSLPMRRLAGGTTSR